jgi:hypothetical protein
MFGSSVLDIAVGLLSVYLIVSLVCTAANETIASMLGWRAATLREGIRNLLDGPDPKVVEWANKFYGHPLIQGLSRAGHLPSYVPSRTFALALMDLVLPQGLDKKTSTAEDLRRAVEASPCPASLKQVLAVLIDESERSGAAGETLRLRGVMDMDKLDTLFNHLHQQIELWFDNSMERVSGWYKRRVQACTLTVAVVLCVGLNVDTVLIARHLSRDSALRSAIVAQAQQLALQPISTSLTGSPIEDRMKELNAVGIPLGWPDPDHAQPNASWWLLKFFGILLTAGAASLGAPFWFDVLNRFISIRSSGKAPEETPKPPKQVAFTTPPAPQPSNVSGPITSPHA